MTKVQLCYLRVAVMIPRINVWHFVSMDMLLLQDMLFWQPLISYVPFIISVQKDTWSGSQSVQVFYCLFISVLFPEIQLSEGEGWNHINWFNAAASTSSQELDFQCHILWGFFYVQRFKVRNDCFGYIGGIVDHRC